MVKEMVQSTHIFNFFQWQFITSSFFVKRKYNGNSLLKLFEGFPFLANIFS